MSDWSDGYVADIEYTYGYYTELNPLRVAMPFMNVGLVPPKIVTACELGYGQGVTVNIHAAASDIRWYGTDFHPGQASFALSLAETAGSGAQLYDDSFAEFCGRPDLPDFDFIALHGIYSWISDENQRIIVDFLRRKLKVGGVLYISYNTQPGFASTAPLQHLMAKHAEFMAPPGQGLLAKVDGAIDFIDKLFALNPLVVTANPGIAERLRYIKTQNRHYVAHEYFNEHWRPLPFSEMARHLAPAKLSFACSAHYLDHLDALNLTPEQRRFITEATDPIFRQVLRDFVVNQQFRRDYWVKGARRLSSLDQAEMVRQQRIMLVGNRSELALSVNGSLGKREMAPNVYTPIVDVLGDNEVKSIGELEQRLSGSMALSTIFEAIMVLAGKGDILPVQDEAAQARAKPHTDRLNLAFFEKARSSGDVIFLASPVTGGGGIAAGRFNQLFLLALRQGPKTADELAQFAWNTVSAQGQRVVKEGKALETPEENLAELAVQARDFLDKRLSLFRKLLIA